MKSSRDLLVLSKKASPDPKALELEVEQLNKILLHVEALQQFCIANEIIDINRYKIISDPKIIERKIRERQLKPFVFVNNKN